MRNCTICHSQARAAIEAELVAKTGQMDIASRYSVSQAALSRHLRKHMDKPISLAQESAPNILDQLTGTTQERLNKLIEIAAALLSRAVSRSSVDTQIRGLSELRKVIELMEKVAGNLPPDTEIRILQVNIPEGTKRSGPEPRSGHEPGRPEQLLPG